MLSLRGKSLISCLNRAASWARVCHKADPRLVGQSPVSKCLSPRPFFGFLGFSFHFSPRAARFCSLFRQSHFQQNQILDSLNCGAHSGALRPCRISKTYLSIMLCLSRGEIFPRPIDEAVSAAISTFVHFSGPRDWRYSRIRV
jgi:hypothetical protein